MFDVVTYLKRHMVSTECAELVGALFGSKLTQSELSKAMREEGVFDLGWLIIDHNNFHYSKRYLDVESRLRLNADDHIMVHYEKGKLTVGMNIYHSNSTFHDEYGHEERGFSVRFIEMPASVIFGKSTAIPKKYDYDPKTCEDFLNTFHRGRAKYPEEAKQRLITSMLKNRDQFSENFFLPDDELDFLPGFDGETILKAIKLIIKDPHELANYNTKSNEFSRKIM